MKAINVRDRSRSPKTTQAMGLFKKWAFESKMTQEKAFVELVSRAYEFDIINFPSTEFCQEFRAPKVELTMKEKKKRARLLLRKRRENKHGRK